jgi:hypothetical protein
MADAIPALSAQLEAAATYEKDLAELLAEQDERARIRQTSSHSDSQNPYGVRNQTMAELERVKRELRANLGLITADSPAHVPILAHMKAIDAELAERAENQKVNRSAAVPTGTEPMGCDPLTTLSNEYGAEWKVWNPGRYVADHRRIYVTLISDSVSGLAEKLCTFTELIKGPAVNSDTSDHSQAGTGPPE